MSLPVFGAAKIKSDDVFDVVHAVAADGNFGLLGAVPLSVLFGETPCPRQQLADDRVPRSVWVCDALRCFILSAEQNYLHGKGGESACKHHILKARAHYGPHARGSPADGKSYLPDDDKYRSSLTTR